MLVATTVSANTIQSTFKADTILPAGLQTEILNALNLNCPQGIVGYGLREVQTEVVRADHSTGLYTIIYKTVISSLYYPDYHPTTTQITVYSQDIIGQGDGYAVNEILADRPNVCN